ncbi:MAG: alternative ribosome rescue aminoacyl-tRNA hydrolase ArfB [Spirochaetes bacterium]|nr:alternative ribosome rescue aminoacyl-tRNA hydrolase ArfB [Spirochaetota bacterium]
MDSHRIEETIRASAIFTFARSGGPGGQNVNKVSSKAILRLPLGRFAGLAGLSEAEIARVRAKLGRRLNDRGDLVMTVQDTRDQAKNREIAVRRAAALVAGSMRRPKRRVETRPSTGSREARLASKKRRGASKRLRSSQPEED